MIALETRSLNKSFGSLAATQDVSLAFEAGLRYAIIGPNGAGKTTYFNLLAGNLRPDSGAILFAGRDVTRLDVTSRAQASASRVRSSATTCFPISRSATISCWPARFAPARRGCSGGRCGRPRRQHAEADEIAEQVGLADVLGTTVRQLSYGSQRQLEVALALACQPQVLLLDEPTSGMSPEETARMHELISAIPRSLTVIVIEHDMDIVLDIADRIIVLDYGRVLEQGTPAEIRASTVVRERYLGEPAAGFSGGAAP